MNNTTCSKITKTGKQCSRKVKLFTTYCFQHTTTNNYNHNIALTIFKIDGIPNEIVNYIYGFIGNKTQWNLLQVSWDCNESIKSYYSGYPNLWQKQFSLYLIKTDIIFKKEDAPILLIATHGTDYDFFTDVLIELCSKTNLKPVKTQYSGLWDIAIMKRWSIPKIQNNKYFPYSQKNY